jgi:peptidyl-prolyl cis-trans isomerase SurA
MKKLFIIVFLILGLNAKIVDKVVASVEGIPITSYEIEKFSKENNIPKNRALNILIEEKLIQNEIKKRGIDVDDFEVEEEMEKLAKQNGMDLFQFKNILMQRGELEKLKKKIKGGQKFYELAVIDFYI